MFDGDTDSDMAHAQDLCRDSNIDCLASWAWREWNRAQEVVTGVGAIWTSPEFHYGNLEIFHDVMAAEYRLKYAKQVDPESLVDLKSDRWSRWFRSELNELKNQPLFVRSVYLAAIGKVWLSRLETEEVLQIRYLTLVEKMKEWEKRQQSE